MKQQAYFDNDRIQIDGGNLGGKEYCCRSSGGANIKDPHCVCVRGVRVKKRDTKFCNNSSCWSINMEEKGDECDGWRGRIARKED